MTRIERYKTSSGSYLENSTISVGIGLKKLQTRSSSVSVKSLDGGRGHTRLAKPSKAMRRQVDIHTSCYFELLWYSYCMV